MGWRWIPGFCCDPSPCDTFYDDFTSYDVGATIFEPAWEVIQGGATIIDPARFGSRMEINQANTIIVRTEEVPAARYEVTASWYADQSDVFRLYYNWTSTQDHDYVEVKYSQLIGHFYVVSVRNGTAATLKSYVAGSPGGHTAWVKVCIMDVLGVPAVRVSAEWLEQHHTPDNTTIPRNILEEGIIDQVSSIVGIGNFVGTIDVLSVSVRPKGISTIDLATECGECSGFSTCLGCLENTAAPFAAVSLSGVVGMAPPRAGCPDGSCEDFFNGTTFILPRIAAPPTCPASCYYETLYDLVIPGCEWTLDSVAFYPAGCGAPLSLCGARINTSHPGNVVGINTGIMQIPQAGYSCNEAHHCWDLYSAAGVDFFYINNTTQGEVGCDWNNAVANVVMFQ